MKEVTIEWPVFAKSDNGKLSGNSPTPSRSPSPSSSAPRVLRTSRVGNCPSKKLALLQRMAPDEC